MIKGLEVKQYGDTPQECFEEGLPDKNGYYYFEAKILESKYCSEDKYRPHTYFNICYFDTECPIPYLSFNKTYAKNIGTIIGNTIELLPLNRYKFMAKIKDSGSYGMQYEILKVWECESTEDDAANNYLKFFVTPKQFETIMNTDSSFCKKVLNDDSYVGERFKGMRKDRFDSLKSDLREYKDYVGIISKFAQFPEISLNSILKMSKIATNPKQAFSIIKENPYVLTDISGFGWKRVDKIASKINPEAISSTQRLISFCQFILEDIANASDGGHTWIYINNTMDVKHSMAHLIRDNVPECQPLIKDYFATERQLTKEKGCGTKFYVDDEKIGLAKYYNSEKSILKHLYRIQNGGHLENNIPFEYAINSTDKWMSDKVGEEVHLTEEQKDAIKATLDNDIVILTAHAGAGKSTTIKGIMELWKDKRISCCALAAKAAIRIQEVSGDSASTIHRLLEYQQGRFIRNEDNPLDADIVIVDECSMINVGLFLNLVRAVKTDGKLILVFDDAQLPAIGAGSVAKDLLGSDFCIKRLTKIHRQAAKSGIKIDANKIRQQFDVFKDDYDKDEQLPKYITHGEKNDMHYFNLRERYDIHKQTIDIYKSLINDIGRELTQNDITIIVPMKSNMENCTDSFNKEIQELLLGSETQYITCGKYSDKENSPRIFKKGCRVIRRKNDYELDVFNGEVGTLIDITSDLSQFVVKFDDGREIRFEAKELFNFDLAYALTVHSMQGSENKIIIFVMDSRHNILLDSTLFYTAITRAKEENYVVFQPAAYKAALTTDKVCARQTFLPLLMKNNIEEDNEEENNANE